MTSVAMAIANENSSVNDMTPDDTFCYFTCKYSLKYLLIVRKKKAAVGSHLEMAWLWLH